METQEEGCLLLTISKMLVSMPSDSLTFEKSEMQSFFMSGISLSPHHLPPFVLRESQKGEAKAEGYHIKFLELQASIANYECMKCTGNSASSAYQSLGTAKCCQPQSYLLSALYLRLPWLMAVVTEGVLGRRDRVLGPEPPNIMTHQIKEKNPKPPKGWEHAEAIAIWP
uniref:Uncharacterized protein n=1 Tax=Cannabis sativa TaxID=3483 RepID=A0A803QQW3_CANSA